MLEHHHLQLNAGTRLQVNSGPLSVREYYRLEDIRQPVSARTTLNKRVFLSAGPSYKLMQYHSP